MTSAPVTSGFIPQGMFQNPTVLFVVEEETIPVETRFLLPCDYFNQMLQTGMTESLKGRIVVTDVSAATFKEFINYLKRPLFPSVDYQGALGLLTLGHKYMHHALQVQAAERLKQDIPSHLVEILPFACLFEDCAELKNACQTYAQQNSYQVRPLLSQLIEEEEWDAFGEVLKWNRDCLYQMMQHSDGSRTPFHKLLEKQKFGLAAQYLEAAKRTELRTYNLVANPQEAVFQLLSGEKPTKDQNALIKAIAHSQPEILTNSSYQRQETPLHVALKKGWDETFEEMLKGTSNNVYNCYAGNQTLMSLAISLKRIAAIQAMQKQMQPISEDEARRYVKESVDTDNPAVVHEALALPCKGYYQNTPQRVDRACIEAVISKGSLAILRLLWPHFTSNREDAAQLRRQAFTEGKFQLAGVLFSEDFDASTELFPGDDRASRIPWIHKVAADASLEWVQFMLARCKNPNVTASYHFKETSYKASPILHALFKGREAAIIRAFLDAGIDVNAGEPALLPVHYICAYRDSGLLRDFLARKPHLDKPDYKGQNFFHLYFENPALLTQNEFRELVKTCPEALKAADKEGNTPLHLAIQTGHLQEAFLMLCQESSVLWTQNKKKQQPLSCIQGTEVAKTISFFVDQTCDSQNVRLKRSLLLWCAQNYYYPFCEQLIKAGADITVTQRGNVGLLHLASLAGAHEAVKRLLALNLPIDASDENGRTPLHIAADRGDAALAEILLGKQANPNVGDKTGKTPLHIAVDKEDGDLVALLILKKANPNQMDHQGDTPLSQALEKSEKGRSDKLQKIIGTLETDTCKVQ